jgi:uncharacterized membrane protein YbhN (UPF0104 family)
MKLTVRLLVTLVILALILRSIDLDALVDVLARTDMRYLAVALALQFCSSALAALRWRMLMENLRFGMSTWFYLRSYFKGMFFNQGLPTSIGGDAIRILDVASRGFRRRDALYAVTLDRVVGLFFLLVIPILAGLYYPVPLPPGLFVVILLLGVGGLLGFVCALSLSRWPWLWRQPRLRVIAALSERLKVAFRKRKLRIACASVVVHLLASVCIFATGRALGIELGLWPYLVLVPLALLFAVLPISIAGWGVREGAVMALFSSVGTDTAAALAMSLLYGLILAVVSLPGLTVYLRDRRR